MPTNSFKVKNGLDVKGDATLQNSNGITTIEGNSLSLYSFSGDSNIVQIGTGSSLILKTTASSNADTNALSLSGSSAIFGVNIKPISNSSIDIGSSSLKLANIYATTFIGTLSGNANTATTLQTPRTIAGVSFNGSSNISIPYANLTSIPSTFTPSAHTLDSHSNVTITSNTNDEILKWNGSAWINNTLAEAGISATSHTHSNYLLNNSPSVLSFTNNTTWSLENGGTNTHGLGIINNSSTANTGAQLNLRANTFDCTIVAIGSGTNTGSLRFYTDINTLAMSIGDNTTSGLVTFNTTPKVNSTLVSLEGHTHSYLPLSGGTMTGFISFGIGKMLIDGLSNTIINPIGDVILSAGASGGLYLTCDNKSWIIDINGVLRPLTTSYNLGLSSARVATGYFNNLDTDVSLTVNGGFVIETAEHATDRSSRILFKENSTNYLYGLSIGYSGDTAAGTYESSGATTNGSNALWYFKRHDNDLNGATVIYGTRSSNDVNFLGNILLKNDNTILSLGASNDLQLYHDATNSYILNSTGILTVGTTSATSLYLRSGGTNRWSLNSSGHIIPLSSGVYDIGAETNRVTNIYANYLYTSSAASIFSESSDLILYQANSANEIELRSCGAVTINIDSNNNDTGKKFRVIANNSPEVFSVNEEAEVRMQKVIITDSSGNDKFMISYNSTTDSLDTVKL